MPDDRNRNRIAATRETVFGLQTSQECIESLNYDEAVQQLEGEEARGEWGPDIPEWLRLLFEPVTEVTYPTHRTVHRIVCDDTSEDVDPQERPARPQLPMAHYLGVSTHEIGCCPECGEEIDQFLDRCPVCRYELVK